MKQEKKGKGALIISIIVTFICVCVCIYVTKNRVTPSVIINKVKTEMEIEVDINDTSIKNDLSNKIDYLLIGKKITTDYINAYDLRRGEESERGDIFNNIDNETRLRIILDYLNNEGKFSKIKNKDTGIEDVDSTIRFVGIDSVKQITVNEVEKYYKILFGETEHNLEDVKGCAGYYYDERKQLYYKLDQTCKEEKDLFVYVYKSSYRKIEDTAFVDVYFGYVLKENDNYIAYRDFDLTKSLDIDDFTLGNKFIDENNYNEFEHYRFNFKLDDHNNYYFTYITK